MWQIIAGTCGEYEFDGKDVRRVSTKRIIKKRKNSKGTAFYRLHFDGKDHAITAKSIIEFRTGNNSRMKKCAVCGAEFEAYTTRSKFCSARCKKKHDNTEYNGFHVKRAKRHGCDYEYSITLPSVIEKYDGVCQICGQKVDPRVFKKMPTIDHIVPLSKGGAHKWENVQLACMSCNSHKASYEYASG